MAAEQRASNFWAVKHLTHLPTEIRKGTIIRMTQQEAPSLEVRRSLWDVKQTAKYIGMSPSFVTKAAVSGQIPALKLGIKWKFRPESIEQWLRALEAGGLAPDLGDSK